MGEFSHPAAPKLLAEVKKAFEGSVFDSRKKFFLFVCGGPIEEIKGTDPTLRRQFLQWSKSELPDFIVVLAEEAFKQMRLYRHSRAVNLGFFEKLIAQVADILIIFPESPGSFSEVGFFSNADGIPIKTMVANDSKFRGEPSFLNNGPLRTIDSRSVFSPRIDVRTADPIDDFAVIKRKLEIWKTTEKRERFTYAPYGKLDLKQRMIVILEMLHILRLATLEDLRYAIKETFGPAGLESVRRMLAILVSASFVTDFNGRYAVAKDRESMLEFDTANMKETLVARMTEYYQNHRPELFEAVRAWVSS
jgi:hypothetical protein